MIGSALSKPSVNLPSVNHGAITRRSPEAGTSPVTARCVQVRGSVPCLRASDDSFRFADRPVNSGSSFLRKIRSPGNCDRVVARGASNERKGRWNGQRYGSSPTFSYESESSFISELRLVGCEYVFGKKEKVQMFF